MTVHREVCQRCSRTVYEPGRARVIEAAKTGEGAEPVEALLQELEKSGKRKDMQLLADMAVVLEEFGLRGTLVVPRELNELRDGLWELKVGELRFPFYTSDDASHPAPAARLTSSFRKRTLRTPRHEIDRALWVMREDTKA